ncbi:hypothetical protein GCM10022403_047400 [Streptomyces coacervatus]|uniref:non-specific serine/threonine protein kinase n=1 Tax=Streptomyces coacervatus TaxID=647381 RepID=A0ABP7HYY5_9ACTN|nr:serine/threonine-protein kinase [Streptomyces coacervatus]MDF2266400.1 serine/threonine-protein kinase [Streptomyces coacervatus]
MPERLLDARYRLAGRIGSGGMGEVWRAYDEHLHRDVAVKLLTGVGAGQDHSLAARFVREARAAARLSSPYIVTVHELGMAQAVGDAEVPYLVMELLNGRSLDRVIREDGPPVLAHTARWAEQLCRALGTAHAADVVHRDMKPANVLVTGGERDAPDNSDDRAVKVLDFGIARILDGAASSATLTATGSIVGTPAYMSPEQARGDGPVDLRTDLYSLGCILYELTTGRPPFEAPAWHVLLLKHMNEPPLPPSRLRPGLPRAWDELILALLSKEPDDRPASALEVRGLLAALDAPAPPTPRPGGPAAEAATRTTPPPPRSTPVRPPTQLDAGGGALQRSEPTAPPLAAKADGFQKPARTRANAPQPAVRSPGMAEPLSAAAVVLVITGLLLPWWAAIALTAATGTGVHLRNRRRSRRYLGRHL